MKDITKYYTPDEIVEAVLNQDPEFAIVCKLIHDDTEGLSDDDINKVKNKEL